MGCLHTGDVLVNDGQREFKDHGNRTGVKGAGKKGRWWYQQCVLYKTPRGRGGSVGKG